MPCIGRELKEAPAKRPLPRGAWPLQPALLEGQQWLLCSASQEKKKERGDYSLARLQPPSWEHIVYKKPVMGLDQLKHGMHCMFQADAKPEHSNPDVGLILLHLF